MIITLGTTPAYQRTMTFAKLDVDAVNRALEVREYASGKSINAARVIHTMGRDCIATGILGGDRGAACRRDMDRVHIPHDFVSVASQTRMCITLIDKAAGTATELIEEGGPVSFDELERLVERLGAILTRSKVLVLSGTLAPGCGDDLYARCVKIANAAGIKSIVDAKGAPLRLALAAKPFIVKPNRSELAQTVDRPIESDADLREAIRQVISMGASRVVVTNGAKETIVSDGREFWHLHSPKVDVVSPIGSGDAFGAGIAMGLVENLTVPESCKLGVACGAANAMTDLAGHVRRDDVERLRTAVTITQ